MTKKTNKNLFGMTVTALNDKVVSCAHMEPINGEQTFQDELTSQSYSLRTHYVALFPKDEKEHEKE